MQYCPNCDNVVQEKRQWENNHGTRLNVEHICQCGCRWVDRYDFVRRDVIIEGERYDG